MKIFHNITFTDEKNEKRIIDELKANNIIIGEYLLNVKISEDDDKWPVVKILISRFDHIIITETKFSLEELESVKWLKISPEWHHGYPMPDDDFGYREITYDLKNYCEACGIGKVQIAPFHMKSEPKWGKKNILQLNWIYDVLFTTPELWEECFKPMGIEQLPVIHHRKNVALQTVVQLKIDSLIETNLVTDDFQYEICRSCGRKKFIPFQGRGFYPPMCKVPSGMHAVKSIENFGSGAEAHKEIFISQELLRKIYKKAKGVHCYPVSE